MKAKAKVNKDDSETITAEFEVVREVKLGRPLFLTPKRFLKICHLIEKGESATEACRQQLVTFSLFRAHVTRNPKYQKRLRRAEKVREEFLHEWHMANVRKHAPKTVIASLWWLERTRPDRYAIRQFSRIPEGNGEQVIGDKVSESDLKRYAEQMADFQKSNETKQIESESAGK
jgi:hypothetical protein